MRTCACGCGDPISLTACFVFGHSFKYPVAPRYVVDECGCWVWQRGFFPTGYGATWKGNRRVLAHRVYFEERHGYCPDTLDHLCRNPACVNPDHLEPCSRGENVRRGDVAILDWEKVAEIRAVARTMRCSQREQARRLAPDYAVAEQTIRQVLRGRRWPESDRPVDLEVAA